MKDRDIDKLMEGSERSREFGMTNRVLFVFTFIYLFYFQTVSANPTNPTVIDNSAQIAISPDNPNHLIITQSGTKSIINWQEYNIDPNQITEYKFIGSDPANSISLNRVTGPNASFIDGNLIANGQVWIVNPAGIIFGKNAKVDVAGILATVSDIKNEDFMKSNYVFQSSKNNRATVINYGHIKVRDSGIAALVAPGAQNRGIIEANLGKVVLGSGTHFTVDLFGDNLIHFTTNAEPIKKRPKTPDNKLLKDAVRNSGKIFAKAGKVVLTTSDAEQIVENLINMDGIIRADTAEMKNGEIILSSTSKSIDIKNLDAKKGMVKVSGKIDARGLQPLEKGGNVIITGPKTNLFNHAKINTLGMSGAGNVYIGGDYKGSGTIPRAQSTIIGKDVYINANAIRNGNGGRVIVWADRATRYYGTISTCGGKLGGDGGFVETSGGWLDTRGQIFLKAFNGKAGTWLIDPADVNITAIDPSTNGTFVTGPPGTQTWEPNASPSNLFVVDIENRLNLGENVIVVTNTAVGGNGDISLLANITVIPPNPVTLTLQADRNIIFANNVTIANNSALQPLNLTFNAANDFTAGTNTRLTVVQAIGHLSVTTGNNFTLGNLSDWLGGNTANFNIGGSLTTIGNARINRSFGVNITANSLTLGSPGEISSGFGPLTFNIATLMTQNGGNITIPTPGTLTINAGDANLTNVFSNGTLIFNVTNTLNTGNSAANTNMLLTAGSATGNVTANGPSAAPLTLDVNTANLTGSVNGQTDGNLLKDQNNNPHIAESSAVHPFLPGTRFFNGVDQFSGQPQPTPTPQPTPQPTPPSTNTIPNIITNPVPPPQQPTPPPSSTPESPIQPQPPQSTPPSTTPTGTTPTTPTGATPTGPQPPTTTPTPPSTTPTPPGPGPTPPSVPPELPPPPVSHGPGEPDVPIGGGQEGREAFINPDEHPQYDPEGATEIAGIDKEPPPPKGCGECMKGEPGCETGRDPQGANCVQDVNSEETPVQIPVAEKGVGPAGIEGTDVPMGARGIGGSIEGKEQETAESLAEKSMQGIKKQGIGIGNIEQVVDKERVGTSEKDMNEFDEIELELQREYEIDPI